MKISKFFQASAMCAGLLMLMGCPYTSTVPLSGADTKAPDYLIGTWELSGSEEGGDKVEIKRGSGNNIEITKTSTGEYGSTENYVGHITNVSGVMFVNLAEVSEYEDSPSSYYLYKIQKESDNKVILFSVTGNIRETFDSSDQLKSFVSSNMQNSYFFDSGEETYYKIK